MTMVTAEADINWDVLAESYNDSWSACSLKKKWKTLKRRVDGFEHMDHRGLFFQFDSLTFEFYMICWAPEIVSILQVRHSDPDLLMTLANSAG
jgi:hypothetical protein